MSERRRIVNWGVAFSAITGIVLTLIATRFIQYMPDISSAKAMLFISTGLFSHFTLMALLFLLLVILPIGLLTPRLHSSLRFISILSATVGTVLLIADTFVYAQYRFHITGFVLEMLIQGGSQIIDLSWVTWGIIAGSLTGIYLVFRKVSNWLWQNSHHPLISKHKSKYLAVFFACLLGSNVLHLWADAQYDQRITALVRHVPMYSPATAKEALLSSGFLDAESIRENRHEFKLPTSRSVVYPKSELITAEPNPKLNILLVILDSARFDILDPDVMPNYWAFSQGQNTQTFNQHISGGNSTRTGVFNLFYGIPGTYWDAFSSSQTAPVLMDTLQKYAYDMSIHAAAPLTQPAFDRTVFANVENFPLTTEGDTPWQRDEKITQDFLNFIKQRQATNTHQSPFFGFLFYDGIHGFSTPDDAEKPFQPAWKRVDHLSLNSDFDAGPYFNLYKNAAYQVDKQLGKVLAQLKQQQLLENTIVIITSDHGQEFNDNGLNYWGHGSNFTPAQVHVPLAIHWPGKPKAIYAHRTTHSDISVTLMEDLFQTQSPAQDYSLGHHLLETERASWSIAGSYVNYAVIEPNYQVVTYQTGHYEVLDNSARALPEQTIDAKTSLAVMEALSHFYKAK
ncbi:MAG: DUF3413 domain-containing protein [Gammaproteobacteria bacterium]|nr:DUF3413 domain-containing protein [Gammaproteobacteria bacterium]